MDKKTDTSLRIAIVTESYAPLNTSAAVQLAQLAQALHQAGHKPVVVVPTSQAGEPVINEIVEGNEVIRLRMGMRKGTSYARRLFYEALMPFAMRRRWKSIAAHQKIDGIVWYSPSIFHGIFASYLMRRYRIPGYLILRDIFPDWAVDLGIISGRSPVYLVLKAVAHHQYRSASVIGVQSPGNLPRLQAWVEPGRRTVEVLHNWYAPPDFVPCQIDFSKTLLAGRRIFVYSGNMGPAQNMGLFVDLSEALRDRSDLGFVFVGRGADFHRIQEDVAFRKLDNLLVYDEIPSIEMPSLYAQCDFGIVSLHPKHKTYNIPGKFLSYIAHDLPVLAAVNAKNDMIALVENNNVGEATSSTNIETLKSAVEALTSTARDLDKMKAGCKKLSGDLFQPQSAAKQIVAGLERERFK